MHSMKQDESVAHMIISHLYRARQ